MNVLGERTRSLWMNVDVYPDAPKFSGKKSCDTVIIGSGIAGLSIAHELASIGQKVIVIERADCRRHDIANDSPPGASLR